MSIKKIFNEKEKNNKKLFIIYKIRNKFKY